MKTKIIKDIRLYESNKPNISGNSLPRELGKLMHASITFTYWAIRIARKLNEMQFSLGEADHLYINFTNYGDINEFQISDRKPTSRIQYVDACIDFENFNQQSVEMQENDLVTYIFKALRLVTPENQHLTLSSCETIIKAQGKNTMIHYKTKEINTYKVDITYQIAPDDKTKLMLVKYTNKITNEQQYFQFPVRFYDDIYALVDTIKANKKQLEIFPKKSFRAELYNGYYKTPIVFNLI